MAASIDFADACERDFELIFDHLYTNYLEFGETPQQAFDHAAKRILEIREAANRLATFPIRGTSRDDILPGARSIAIGKAIDWFTVDDTAERVRILAVFFGGQDHIRHMLRRALER